MATYLMCAVRDVAVGAFMAPFVCRSRGEAIRGFTDAVNDPKMEFHKHPEDYQLFWVGEWDDYAGLMRELTTNELLISASDCLMTTVEYKQPVDLSQVQPLNLNGGDPERNFKRDVTGLRS